MRSEDCPNHSNHLFLADIQNMPLYTFLYLHHETADVYRIGFLGLHNFQTNVKPIGSEHKIEEPTIRYVYLEGPSRGAILEERVWVLGLAPIINMLTMGSPSPDMWKHSVWLTKGRG